jgi:hypothetical protein
MASPFIIFEKWTLKSLGLEGIFEKTASTRGPEDDQRCENRSLELKSQAEIG